MTFTSSNYEMLVVNFNVSPFLRSSNSAIRSWWISINFQLLIFKITQTVHWFVLFSRFQALSCSSQSTPKSKAEVSATQLSSFIVYSYEKDKKEFKAFVVIHKLFHFYKIKCSKKDNCKIQQNSGGNSVWRWWICSKYCYSLSYLSLLCRCSYSWASDAILLIVLKCIYCL